MNTPLAHRLSAQTVVATCLVLAQGCAHMERAEYDPCAEGTRDKFSKNGHQVTACYTLDIPFRIRLIDAATQLPIAGAIAVHDWYIPAPPGVEDDKFGISLEDGVMNGTATTIAGVPNPYSNACFRRDFPGILIEFQQVGYARYRCRVPLPAAEGEIADLGVIQLIANQE